MTLDKICTIFQEVISRVCQVAVHEGEVAGTYYIKPNQPGLASHVCNAGFMVDSKVQGQGIGRALGEHSLVEARKLGFKAMQFNFVTTTNKRAVKLWLDLGFSIVGTLPKAFQHRLGFVDVFVMYRFLES